MSLGTFYLAHVDKLPKRLNRVKKRRDIALTMSDGVVLMTDHYAPRGDGSYPTILMRLPYGRKGFSAIAEIYAERGFHVVLQACRGTEKSGGEFDPLVNERADGLTTLDWIKAQPWFDGRLGLSGPSYLGYAQWAICDALPETAAMAAKVTSADFRSVVFPAGAFHLGLWLSWLQVIEGLKRSPLQMTARMFSGGVERITEKASMMLPLVEADVAAIGRSVPFWRRWFRESIGNDAFWEAIDHRPRLSKDTPPVHLMSGWYDFMLDQLLADYQRLVELGHRPYLTVGTWTHIADELQRDNLRETLIWMRAKLLGDPSGLREKPVRIHISGIGQWREFDAYPPAPPNMQSWCIAGQGRLLPQNGHDTERQITPDEPDSYRYDPADPTPNVGGAMFAFTGAGPVDNAPRENRKDVLTYTSEPLTGPLTIIGNVDVTLFARASIPHVDFFVRLCDVSPGGVSININDGLIRVTSETPHEADGTWRLAFKLHATAHCFTAGHRLRLQISSGAHPRYARNLGTDEDIGTATIMQANDIEILREEGRTATIALPVYDLEAL